MRANDSGQAIAIGNRQGRIAQLRRAADQLVGMRGSLEEREIRFGVNFGVHGGGARGLGSGARGEGEREMGRLAQQRRWLISPSCFS